MQQGQGLETSDVLGNGEGGDEVEMAFLGTQPRRTPTPTHNHTTPLPTSPLKCSSPFPMTPPPPVNDACCSEWPKRRTL